MVPAAPDLDALINAARRGFAAHFGRSARVVVAAPGRVNLIGDHTDYNDGLVLPMAIDRFVVIAADRSATTRVHSAAFGETIALDGGAPPSGWARYVHGVRTLAAASGRDAGPFDAWVESSVPVGAGLSSSAALDVACATLVEALTGAPFDPIEKARLCRRVEHEFAGVPCGIMDPFVIANAQAGAAIRLDCRTETAVPVALDPTVAVLIADTRTERALADGTYAARRAECAEAAARLGLASLRDARATDLVPGRLPDVLLRRVRHVVSENERVGAMVGALHSCRWHEVGRLMAASHDSLRDDFEVTGPALDAMVELGRTLPGVIGSRMTGGGLGGCAVLLTQRAAARTVAASLTAAYEARTGRRPVILTAVPVAGAGVIAGP